LREQNIDLQCAKLDTVPKNVLIGHTLTHIPDREKYVFEKKKYHKENKNDENDPRTWDFIHKERNIDYGCVFTPDEVVKKMISTKLFKDEEEVRELSKCFLKGVQVGNIIINDKTTMDTVVAQLKCSCQTMLTIKVKDVIHQEDEIGSNYDGGEEPNWGILCEKCEELHYLEMCHHDGMMLQTGKFHNHCTAGLCGNNGRFGECIGDYRMHHCGRCEYHYWNGAYQAESCETCYLKGGYLKNYEYGRFSESESDSDSDDGSYFGGGGSKKKKETS